ncbi:fungal-specific transcription factor domain-containing protein, partial [Parasitella parasitica]
MKSISPSDPSISPSTKRVNKRLKVGRACYTCRAKKIKCDGLRPCMQCKARQRPCSFYKDGSLELDQQNHTEKITGTDTIKDHFDLDSRKNDNGDSDDRIFFTDTSAANHNKLKRRGPLMESRISNTLGTLGENLRKMASIDSNKLAEKLLGSTDTFGNFIMWMPEPSLPSRYSGSIEMPSREIQMALIDQFFNERYESIGLVPRYYFYEQLETKGLMITPLLLNIIYAHAARFITIPNCPKTEVFYQRARRLVDDFMDVPRVSTIVALCLLSLYEPSPAIYRPGAHHCRQWQYSGMACRMAIELGLYDDSHIHSNLTPVEIELRRRVFWGCYDLDKFHSGGWERPFMISQSFIKTSPPTPLPGDSEEEK